MTIQTQWTLNQINEFLNRLNNQNLKKQPLSLKQFLNNLFQIFKEKQLKDQTNDLVLESNYNGSQQRESLSNPMYMAVQFKIHFVYRSDLGQYQSLISLVNTRQHDIAIKKEISESLSQRIFQTLSHEFGTYMNIISNITENALEDDRISIELKKDYFRIIHTNSLLLENVIKDMRDFFSIMNQRLEVKQDYIDLKETLFQTIELFKKQIQLKKLKISIKIQKGVFKFVNSDGQFIKQILSNFISNSLKFTLSGQIRVFLFKHSYKYLRLEVEDSGIGMSNEECERLQGMLKNGFTDEKISKNSVGLGFGLLISNNLARMIGNPGKKQAIYFQSRPQEGSKFWILINIFANKNLQQLNVLNQSKMSFFSKQAQDHHHHHHLAKSNHMNTYQTALSILKISKCQQNQKQAMKKKQFLIKSKSLQSILQDNQRENNESFGQENLQNQNQIKSCLNSFSLFHRSTSNPLIGSQLEKQEGIKRNYNKTGNLIENSLINEKYIQSVNKCLNKNIQYNGDSLSYLNKFQNDLGRNCKLQRTSSISQKCVQQENNEFGQYLQKFTRNCDEQSTKQLSIKRMSDNGIIQLKTQSIGSPIKQLNRRSMNGIILNQNKRETLTQGLSLENSQMISSKIIQMRSRVRHTITNKQQVAQQIGMIFNQGINEKVENVSDHSFEATNNHNQKISKIPQSAFDTPNYLTMSTKQAKLGGKLSNTVFAQGSVNQFSLGKVAQKSKDTLNYIAQVSNNLQVISANSSQSNNFHSSSSHNQNNSNHSINYPTEQSNKVNSTIQEQRSQRCSLEKNLIQNNSQVITKHSTTINSQGFIMSNQNVASPKNDYNNVFFPTAKNITSSIPNKNKINNKNIMDENNMENENEDEYKQSIKKMMTYQQGKSNRQLEQRIIEEQGEDDTKMNNTSSDNYSPNINANDSSLSSYSPTHKQSHSNISSFHKQKAFKDSIEKGNSTYQNQYSRSNSQNSNTQKGLSISSSTRKKNSDDSDCSFLTNNNSVSIEYVAQRDAIEYSDYEFDDLSLDDLDQVINPQNNIANQQNSTQSHVLSSTKYLKTPTTIGYQQGNLQQRQQLNNHNYKNVDKLFEDINAKTTKTLNDFKTLQKISKKQYKNLKQNEEGAKNTCEIDYEDDNEENNKLTIPSERALQMNDLIEQQDYKVLASQGKGKGEQTIKLRGLIHVQKIMNTESVPESKEGEDFIENSNLITNKDLKTSINLPFNFFKAPSIPSITLNLKQQKYTTQYSIQDQNVFSFGVDDKLSGGDLNPQNTHQSFLKKQTINFGEGKGNSLRNTHSVESQRKNTIKTQQSSKYLQQSNNDAVQHKEYFNQGQSPHQQQLSKQGQFKMLVTDQNKSGENQNQQQIAQNRFSNSQIQPFSNQTLSMVNLDEYEGQQSIHKHHNVYLNSNLQNMQFQKKILIVDDEIFNIYSLKLIFAKFGLKDLILEAYNGQQAIEQIMNQQHLKSKRNNEEGYQIGMIIMDVNMPIMNGIECTRFIRELEANQNLQYSPNIIGYTAYSDSDTRNQCYDAGMDYILLKPSRRDDFITLLEKFYLNC